MTGSFGFSYIGLLFLLLLFIPNLIWAKNKPKGYTSEHENRILLTFERTGEVLTTTCALIFQNYNIQNWSNWNWWLIAAFLCMAMYEAWWIRYFRSEKTLSDFYSSFYGIPLAGATLPVMAFLLLGIYGKVLWMIISALILGIGHVGIHWQHKKGL